MLGKDGRYYNRYYDLDRDGELSSFERGLMYSDMDKDEEEEERIRSGSDSFDDLDDL